MPDNARSEYQNVLVAAFQDGKVTPQEMGFLLSENRQLFNIEGIDFTDETRGEALSQALTSLVTDYLNYYLPAYVESALNDPELTDEARKEWGIIRDSLPASNPEMTAAILSSRVTENFQEDLADRFIDVVQGVIEAEVQFHETYEKNGLHAVTEPDD